MIFAVFNYKHKWINVLVIAEIFWTGLVLAIVTIAFSAWFLQLDEFVTVAERILTIVVVCILLSITFFQWLLLIPLYKIREHSKKHESRARANQRTETVAPVVMVEA